LVGVVLLLLIADVPVAPYALTGTTEQLQVQEGKHSGEPRNYLRTLQAAALVSPLTSFFGMPPSIIFFESGAAITAGGRTGITAAVAALLFLPLLFAAPLIAMIPIAASALVLIVVGLSIASGGLSRSPKTSESNLLFGIVLASFLVSDSLATGIMAGIATSSVLASRRWLLETQAAK
jgi:AGZA family xanthine/uracil permease-like MFS transporter